MILDPVGFSMCETHGKRQKGTGTFLLPSGSTPWSPDRWSGGVELKPHFEASGKLPIIFPARKLIPEMPSLTYPLGITCLKLLVNPRSKMMAAAGPIAVVRGQSGLYISPESI
jgi:hypothetical protein